MVSGARHSYNGDTTQRSVVCGKALNLAKALRGMSRPYSYGGGPSFFLAAPCTVVAPGLARFWVKAQEVGVARARGAPNAVPFLKCAMPPRLHSWPNVIFVQVSALKS